jgi:hypothetical protein
MKLWEHFIPGMVGANGIEYQVFPPPLSLTFLPEGIKDEENHLYALFHVFGPLPDPG